MKNTLIYLLLCATLFCTLNTAAQNLSPAEIESKIDAMVSAGISDATPGVVVGVVSKGELIFSKGYGLANLSYGIPNDPKKVYNIGSVSKQFLGYAFAMLHVKGDLNIDDPVAKYLDDWPVFEHKVTLRNLLTHTSGYREAYTMSELAGRSVGVDRLSRAECLEVVKKQPKLEFVPGSRWTYNSTAWVILAEVLEKVTGEPADKWVESNILSPLGMSDTQIETFVGEVITNAAESYAYNNELGFVNQESNRAIFGAAEVYTSIEDMARWINNFRTAELGGKAVQELFFDPFILTNGNNSEYALGIGNSSYRGLKRYRHTGGHEAFITFLSYYPQHDLGIVTISNYGGRGVVQTENIAELFLEEFMESENDAETAQVEINSDNLENLKGLYLASTFNDILKLSYSEGSLLIDGNNKMTPISKDNFSVDGWNSQVKIEESANGIVALTILNRNKSRYKKVENWTPESAELTPFEGDYWSDELETLYHLTIDNGQLAVNHRWMGQINLKPLTQDVFGTQWGLFVKFSRNEQAEINGLSVYSGRTLDVFFERK